LTEISIGPLWLGLPSTVPGVSTWFVLSPGTRPESYVALCVTAAPGGLVPVDAGIDELSPVYDVHLHFGGLNE